MQSAGATSPGYRRSGVACSRVFESARTSELGRSRGGRHGPVLITSSCNVLMVEVDGLGFRVLERP